MLKKTQSLDFPFEIGSFMFITGTHKYQSLNSKDKVKLIREVDNGVTKKKEFLRFRHTCGRL